MLYLWAREFPVSDAAEEAEISLRGNQYISVVVRSCTVEVLLTQISLGGPGVVGSGTNPSYAGSQQNSTCCE